MTWIHISQALTEATGLIGQSMKTGLLGPFDSPLETLFAGQIGKYLGESVDFDSQYDVPTSYGTFAVDFVTHSDVRRVGLECDGAAFHDPL